MVGRHVEWVCYDLPLAFFLPFSFAFSALILSFSASSFASSCALSLSPNRLRAISYA